jgi:isoquinoline 1-oxidoreductase
MVTGRHRYTSDLTRPGMLYGKVLRPPAFGATPAALDTSAAEKLAGVAVVRDGDFVGVAAPTLPLAERTLAAIRTEWKMPPEPAPSSKELFDTLRAPAGGDGGRGDFSRGSISEGLAAALHRLESTYTVAFIAHAPLEPRAALAEWGEDGRLTVWTGTQRPFGARAELAAAFGIPEERVRVIVPDTGSGYGGKHTGEAAIEAARLAKAAGKPVKLVWTREEEFTWAYFRPAGVITIRSGVTADGAITAWEFHNYNSGAAAIRPLYEIPHQHVAFHAAPSPLRQGSYRALAATANHFARETHLDELAHTLGMDPLAFRLANLRDERLRAVLTAAAEAIGWGKGKPAAGRGRGIACGFDKGGYVANAVEVSVDPASARSALGRIVTVFECGAIVHPDISRTRSRAASSRASAGRCSRPSTSETGRSSTRPFPPTASRASATCRRSKRSFWTAKTCPRRARASRRWSRSPRRSATPVRCHRRPPPRAPDAPRGHDQEMTAPGPPARKKPSHGTR